MDRKGTFGNKWHEVTNKHRSGLSDDPVLLAFRVAL